MTESRDEKTIRHIKALGRAFAESRRGAPLTQFQLEERSGVSRTHIVRIETGMIDPGYEVMQKLAMGIGVPLGSILNRALELARKEDGE